MDKKLFEQELGLFIRNARKKKNLSQEQLAVLANCGLSQIGTVERGEKGISFYNLYKIARILDIDINKFIKELE